MSKTHGKMKMPEAEAKMHLEALTRKQRIIEIWHRKKVRGYKITSVIVNLSYSQKRHSTKILKKYFVYNYFINSI
jgi:hypothetical protein